ncbi:5873_t:CDS:10, partial [Funneliformis mosseae]
MKVVALISGGKDSCYNMMHCVANGHQIVALANLKPQSKFIKDELDSFLYQTVGHGAIEYIAESMNLPLYRREIMGNSLVQSADYQQTLGDETEDLYKLLKQVKKEHSDIQAVSVGAILSNYQRVRVENVCDRLGLTSLAYLWRRNQKELLKEMINAGINAILIKVAAIGLKTTHLGKSIAQLYPYLCDLNEKYDVHICGEGGEYETFTLDCPLFVKRLSVQEVETVIHSDDAFATVAYLRLKRLIVEEKQASEIVSNPVIVIPSWKKDIEDFTILDKQSKLDNNRTNYVMVSIKIDNLSEEFLSEENLHLFSSYSNPPYYNVSGTTAYDNSQEVQQFESIEEETYACMLNLQEKLHELGLSWSDVVNMNVFIKDMDEFGKMNAIYKKFFNINPPTRACVGSNLPSPTNIQIDLMAIKPISNEESSNPRETMHVQSISYWAPANIGPYSQATIIKCHAFIAGQIGLIPSSLEFPLPQTLEMQTFLSLRNLENVTSVLKLNVKKRTALSICFVDDESSFPFVQNAWKVFCGQSDENSKKFTEPVLYLSVPSLPRRGKVEWQVLIHRDDDGIKNPLVEPKIWQDTSDTIEPMVTKTTAWFMNPILCSVITIQVNNENITLLNLLDGMIYGLDKLFNKFFTFSQIKSSKFWNNIGSIRIFYSKKINTDQSKFEKAIKLKIKKFFSEMKAAITFIPVLAIMDDS